MEKKKYRVEQAVAYRGYRPKGSIIELTEERAKSYGSLVREVVDADVVDENKAPEAPNDPPADPRREELQLKKVPELKTLADEMKLTYPKNIKKDELIHLIMATEASAEDSNVDGASNDGEDK